MSPRRSGDVVGMSHSGSPSRGPPGGWEWFCKWDHSVKALPLLPCGELHTTEPLEDERCMEWMRAARVFSSSWSMSYAGPEPGLSAGASYSSCLKPSSSIRSTMFFKK